MSEQGEKDLQELETACQKLADLLRVRHEASGWVWMFNGQLQEMNRLTSEWLQPSTPSRV